VAGFPPARLPMVRKQERQARRPCQLIAKKRDAEPFGFTIVNGAGRELEQQCGNSSVESSIRSVPARRGQFI